MLTAGKAGLIAVVSASVLVAGALLGDAVEPEMKPPPEAEWRGALPDGGAAYRPAEFATGPGAGIVAFGGFPPEPDAVAVADWPQPTQGWDDAYDAYDDEAFEDHVFPAPDYGDDGDPGFAGYEPRPARSDVERAAEEAARTVHDAALAAAGAAPLPARSVMP